MLTFFLLLLTWHLTPIIIRFFFFRLWFWFWWFFCWWWWCGTRIPGIWIWIWVGRCQHWRKALQEQEKQRRSSGGTGRSCRTGTHRDDPRRMEGPSRAREAETGLSNPQSRRRLRQQAIGRDG